MPANSRWNLIQGLNKLNFVYDCLSTPKLATCPAHIIVLDSIILKPCCEEQILATSLVQPTSSASYLHATLILQEQSPNLSLFLWQIRFRLTTARFTTGVQEPFSS
jgi:hypothetical protein